MMRKVFSTWGMIFVMLVSVVGTAAAQDGVVPTSVPTNQPAESTPYLNPIVQILSAYFGRETRPMLSTPTPTATPTVDPSATPTVDPSATPTATPVDFAKQIATYHQEGMGFGVLVKLYAMAEASMAACVKQQAAATSVAATTVTGTSQSVCEVVMIEQLVSEFQSGTGMGQLFKEYGKSALLGVGQVRKALQKQQQVVNTSPIPAATTPSTITSTPTPVPSLAASHQQFQNNQKSNNGNGQGNKSQKVKTPVPHGRK